ncbi:MAG TPA: ABC transporter permease [Longimicrobiales bacterium]|nr:ABC transporter permease [Longimicrobiales bacterium]
MSNGDVSNRESGSRSEIVSRATLGPYADLGRDLRHAGRALARKPGVTLSAVLALGLGIGLATSIFSFIYGAVYRPLPFQDGDRIMHLELRDPVRGQRGLGVTYHDFQDWRGQQTSFEELAAFSRGTVNLSGDHRPERYFGGFMTANSWDVLGVQPMLGRGFLPGEDQPGAAPVVILSHSVWQARYAEDPEIVGRTIRVNGQATTVVGVMPEGFSFPYWEDVWVPLQVDASNLRRGGGPTLEVFGRLSGASSLSAARTEFQGISSRLAAAYPETNRNLEAVVERYIDSYHGEGVGVGVTFFLAFGVAVLLIACFNVANLLLARAVTQTRDTAVRVALGASRGRIVLRVFQQAALLAVAGAVLGTLMAMVAMRALDRWVAATATFPLPFWMELKVDEPVLLFVVGSVVLSALASGLIPALRSSSADVHATLTDASRGNSSLRIGRISRFLVLSQMTLTATLLVLAGHMAMQVAEGRMADYGYPASDVLTARLTVFEEVLPGAEARREFYRELLTRLQARPGVVSAALGTALPGMNGRNWRVALQGMEFSDAADYPRARVAFVSPGYFRAFEAPILEGRALEATDDAEGLPVALVNQPFVDRHFAGESPLGREIRLGWPEPEGSWYTVVGVVPDLDMDGALNPAGIPEGVYLALAQADAESIAIAIRTRGDPQAFAPVLRDEVASLQGDTPIFFVRTLQDAINTNLLDTLLVGGFLAVLALAALLLASVGLYGVTAFLARQRTREVGVRIALGAKGLDVLRLVVGQGSWQIGLGLTVGLLLAAGSMALMASGGMEISAWSFPVAGIVCAVLGGTGLAAILAPAWRATRVNPVEALRAE